MRNILRIITVRWKEIISNCFEKHWYMTKAYSLWVSVLRNIWYDTFHSPNPIMLNSVNVLFLFNNSCIIFIHETICHCLLYHCLFISILLLFLLSLTSFCQYSPNSVKSMHCYFSIFHIALSHLCLFKSIKNSFLIFFLFTYHSSITSQIKFLSSRSIWDRVKTMLKYSSKLR